MTALAIIALTLVAIGGAVVALTGEPGKQAITLSVYGVLLTVLFLVLQAPDVALSQFAVGSAIVPLMVLLTVRVVAGRRR